MNKSGKRLVVGGIVAGGLMIGSAALVIGAGVAKADTMTSTEIAFADQTSDATCIVFAKYPTPAGLVGIGEAITEHGFTWFEAGQIVGYSIANYCPSELPAVTRAAQAIAHPGGSLVSFHDSGRGGHGHK